MIDLTAADVNRLLLDDTFKEALRRARQQQIDIFVNSKYSEDTLRDAKYMMEAINKIEQALKSVVSDEAIKEKRK